MISVYQYINKYMMIQTKDAGLQHLRPNTAQKKLYELFREKYNSNEPFRVVILKARQLGISTMTEAIISCLTMTHHDKNALIVGHTPESTAKIFSMAKLYHDCLPLPLQPMVKYSNSKTLTFENPTHDQKELVRNPGLRSSIKVALAGSSGIGRGSTYNYMHLSELAFWQEHEGLSIEDQMTGLLQTLPTAGRSVLVVESTANGYNYFKKLWDRAVSGENGFIALFIPWFEMQEYRQPYSGEEFDADERALQKLYSLDNEQIMWRRYAIRTLCGGSVDQFHQEYPSNPEEAFLTSGSTVFDTDIVYRRLQKVTAPVRTGNFLDDGRFITDTDGVIRIWKEPEPGHVYAIGADTAGEGSDYFRAYVMDKADFHQVAALKMQTDEGFFEHQLLRLGDYYNKAMIGVEVNFSSYTTMRLQEHGYMNQYVREVEDTYLNKTVRRFGFRTTSVTRPIIISMLVDYLKDYAGMIEDPDLLKEMLTFVRNDKGRPEAAPGEHDDCVMAFAITVYILPQARAQEKEQEEEEKSIDDYDAFLSYGE